MDDFVFHVGDVHDVADGVAFKFEAASDKVGEDKSPKISDVGKIMHRRPAAIETDPFRIRLDRDKILQRSGQGVKKSQRHISSGILPGPLIQSRVGFLHKKIFQNGLIQFDLVGFSATQSDFLGLIEPLHGGVRLLAMCCASFWVLSLRTLNRLV
jgi:hypothetical protein